MLLNIMRTNSTSGFATNCYNFPILYPAMVKQLQSQPHNDCQLSGLATHANIKKQNSSHDCSPSLSIGLG